MTKQPPTFAEIVAAACPTGARAEVDAIVWSGTPELYADVLAELEKLERIITIRDERLC